MTQATLTPVSSPAASTTAPALRLRNTMAAVRVHLRWLGVRKTLTPEQKAQAADPFGAEGAFLSAGKKLLDTRHPAYRAVTAVRGQISSYWHAQSLPYPESGVRLIRRDAIEAFNARMTELRDQLADAVAGLDSVYPQLRDSARQRLGRLYSDADYPASLAGLFGVDWDFPSVEPPAYLRQVDPGLWEAERQRVAARFDEAVQLAQAAFTQEFARLVDHLAERLAGSGPDGAPKIFRDSAVSNLGEFFERFQLLNVGGSSQLDDLVARARQLLAGVDPQSLRDSTNLRQHVASQLSAVQAGLDTLMVDRPRRALLRPAAPVQMGRGAA